MTLAVGVLPSVLSANLSGLAVLVYWRFTGRCIFTHGRIDCRRYWAIDVVARTLTKKAAWGTGGGRGMRLTSFGRLTLFHTYRGIVAI